MMHTAPAATPATIGTIDKDEDARTGSVDDCCVVLAVAATLLADALVVAAACRGNVSGTIVAVGDVVVITAAAGVSFGVGDAGVGALVAGGGVGTGVLGIV
jgi:hypothetical protein